MKTNLYQTKTRYLLPVFFGSLCALVICAHLAVNKQDIQPPAPCELPGIEEVLIPEEDIHRFFTAASEQKRDLIHEMYGEPDAREWVIDFFAQICDSREIAKVILSKAVEFNIPPALAFSLSWEESRFNPLAVNYKNRDESIDRGLFQLNNRAFPRLEIMSFFDPQVNTHYGMSHLRYCLDAGGSEITALAMYNAGPGKIKATGAPKPTLDYIHRILENRQKIEARFQASLQREAETRIAEKSAEKRTVVTPEQNLDFLLNEFSGIVAQEESDRPRLVRLAPLAMR